MGTVKRRVLRFGEKYFANPPTKALLHTGLPMPLCILETKGRVSGKPRRVPVMNGRVGDQLWIVAEHGHKAGYVRNVKASPQVRVKKGRRWTEGTAHVLGDDDPYERAAWIADQLGRNKKAGVFAAKLMSVDPVTVRVDLHDGVHNRDAESND